MTARARRSPKRPVTVTFGEELTIQFAADSAAQLTAALDKVGASASASGLSLDLTAVQELDTAGLQVLLWAAREARGRGVGLDVLASDAVTEVLALAGLDAETVRAAGADTRPLAGATP